MSVGKRQWYESFFVGAVLLAAAICGRDAYGQNGPSVRVSGVDIQGDGYLLDSRDHNL
jgi:hypothetical protein